MSIFNLPDLGEGLPDAEIVAWHVKEGDKVAVDDILVSMETAKAIVDVPAPQEGRIKTLFGKVGDIINTGSPLIEFDSIESPKSNPDTVALADITPCKDSKTEIKPEAKVIQGTRVKAMPSVRALANKLEVNIATVTPTGPKQRVTSTDVKNAALTNKAIHKAAKSPCENAQITPLRGVRRSMAHTMAQSHAQVVPVTLVDDVDIHSWSKDTDITWRLIRAICKACKEEPALNAHFHMETLQKTLFETVNIGIAMDTQEGLFVPVLKNAQSHEQASFRQMLNTFKEQVQNRSIATEMFQGSTIQLSNFGTFAGRYANPIVVPPNVAIVGIGKCRAEVVAINNAITIHNILPLSLTIDHRAVTGGEAARFLKALMIDLERPE